MAEPRSYYGYFTVTPLADEIGGRVDGIDLSEDFSEGVFAALQQAWLDYQVLLFRDQKLTDGHLIKFSKRFGELDLAPAAEGRLKGDSQLGSKDPAIWVISNVKENGKPIGSLGDGEAEWHTDLSYVTIPPKMSLLYSHEVPPVEAGGCTSWMNMYAALRDLPKDVREKIESKWCNHTSSYTSAGTLREGASEVVDVTQAPGVPHPFIINHPETGKEALYLGRRTNAYCPGLKLEESEALLDEVWDYTMDPKYRYRHEWRVGDFLMWDNRCTMHQREAFGSQYRRIMHRCQVKSSSLLHAPRSAL